MTGTGKFSLFVCFLHILSVYGLFEDQIGKFDWRQQYVGHVEYMLFDQSYGLGKRIIVATEKNVLASINTFNGSLVWRIILEEGDRGKIDSVQHKGNYIVAICGGGRYIRSWHPGTGTLMWEVSLSHEPGSGADIRIHGKDDVIALTPTGLYDLDIHNGKQKWKVSLPNQEKTVYENLAVQDNNVYAIGRSADGHVIVLNVDVDGIQKSQNIVPAAWISQKTQCLLVKENYYICYDQQSKLLQGLDVLSGQAFKASDPQDLQLDTSGELTLEHLQSTSDSMTDRADVMVRMSNYGAAILKVSNKGINLVRSLPKVTAAHVSEVDNSGSSILLALHRSAQDEATLTGYDLASGGEIAEMSQKFVFPSHHGNPLQIEAVLSKKKEGRIIYKMAVLSEDISLQLIHKTGKVAWHREEALAYVMSTDMIDLPVSENQAKFEDEFGSHKDDIATMFVKRFRTQFSQLKTFIIQQIHKLQGHRHHHAMGSDAMVDDDDDDEELTRDEFNLNKMIILVTGPGKIFGMRSTNGRAEWQLFLPELSPFSRYDKEKLFLFVQRTTAHFPNPPQCAVLGRNKKTGQGHIFAFNPITGKPIKGMPPTGMKLNYNVLQVSMIGKMDNNFLKGIVLLDENFKIYTFPESFKSVIEEDVGSIYKFVADVDEGMISGYRAKSAGNELVTDKVWTINLQKKQQTITSIYGKRAVEHVHSQGRVLGDRSVLYKYLNPNLIVIVTEGDDTSVSQKGPGNFISLYLVDSVTGHMIFHCSHKRSKGPVHVIHSENWVVYNYFNQKSRRYEVAVIELFEGKDQSNATAFSSFNVPKEPLILRQSYIMPLAISTMATTITEKGITSKNIIFALKLGGLLSLPKALLDPRRPIIPTQETMEEGTIPYIPELPVSTEAVINYNLSVYNVRDIHTSPAGLESTSLVLSYGLDLFFTRLTPSKMFDVLKEDFDYYFISLVLGGMFLVTFVSQKLAARRALNRAWK